MFVVRGLSYDDLDIAAAVESTAQEKADQRESAIMEHCAAAISKLATAGELEGLNAMERHDYLERRQEDFLRNLVSKFPNFETMRVAGPVARGDVFRHGDTLRLITGMDKNGNIKSKRVEVPDYPRTLQEKSQRIGHDREDDGVSRSHAFCIVQGLQRDLVPPVPSAKRRGAHGSR